MRMCQRRLSVFGAGGMFVVAGFAQTTPPVQNGNYPNGSTSTSTPGFSGNVSTTGGAAGSLSPDQNANSANSAGAPSMNGKAIDMRFAKNAAIGGMTEVELGKLAVSKSSNDKVKQFGQRMIDDHGKAGEELKAIAAKNNMTLPAAMDSKHKAMVDKFSAMSGEQFDKAYIAAMSKDHDKDIAEFHEESQNGTNDDLKSFATKTLPTLQEHDRMVKEIKSSMK